MKLRGIEYNLNCGYNFVIVLFYCVSRVYPLSADRLNFHPNDQGLSSSSGYQGSSSSWNYAYHFNWQSTDHNNPGKGVSRFAETSDSKQYVHPPLAPPLPTPRHHLGINSRTYRHADQNHRIKTNHHVNHHDQVNYHHPGPGDSNAFIENIRNEIMSSFKETLPEHFNGHHDHRPPDYHHHHQERQQRDYNQRDNILDHYGQPNIPDNLFHGRNFHLPSPPITFTSSHEVKPSSTLKRFQRSHKQNHPLPGPEVAGGISKSSSWNFNSNQGFYYRVDDVDGKKHEEQGSYGDGQRSSGSPPSWINNYHQPNINQQQQLGQQINSIQGFPYGSDNFIFPSNHHHHRRNQNQPSIWFQSTFNHNNQDYHRQKVNHGNNYINQKQH